jgi:branched-chain amino acid transport system substrate-binding protein
MHSKWLRWIGGITGIIGVALMAVLISGCGQTQNEIKIGALLALTGPAAEWGQNEYQGLQIAVEEHNSQLKEGEPRFRIVLEDSKSDPKEAVTAFNKMMATDNPSVVLTIQSGVSMAVAPIANQRKKILICSAAAPDLVKVGDYIFRCFPTSNQLVHVLTENAIKHLDITEIYVIYINNDFGRSMRDVFSSEFSGIGGRIIGEDTFGEKQMDFRAQIAKILAKRPNAIFVPGSGAALGLLLKQLKENKYSGTILTTLEASYKDVLNAAGAAAEGIIYVDMPFDLQSDKPEMPEFLETFRQKYGREPILDALIGYDVGRMVMRVIAEHGNESERIRSGLLGVSNFQGLLGSLSMSPTREIEYSLQLKTIRSGRVVAYAN